METQEKKEKKPTKWDKLKAQIKEEVKIVDIAEEFGYTVINRDRKYASLKEHDSCIIDTVKNTYTRYSSNDNGDVFSFMMNMPEINYSFKNAKIYLSKKVQYKDDYKIKPVAKKTKKEITINDKKLRAMLLMNQIKKDDNNRRVLAYLIQTRKILPEVVNSMIDNGNLVQETNEHGYTSAVFIGRDDIGLPACVCKRATSSTSSFKQETSGNDYTFGWLFDPQVDAQAVGYRKDMFYDKTKPLLCFESEIEKMSYMSILKLNGEDINQYAYLSTGSISKYHTILDVAKRIGYSDVRIGYNNDWQKKNNPGQTIAIKTKKLLEENNIKASIFIPENKDNDWNDMLKRIVSERNINPSNVRNEPIKPSSVKDRTVQAKKQVMNTTTQKVNTVTRKKQFCKGRAI